MSALIVYREMSHKIIIIIKFLLLIQYLFIILFLKLFLGYISIYNTFLFIFLLHSLIHPSIFLLHSLIHPSIFHLHSLIHPSTFILVRGLMNPSQLPSKTPTKRTEPMTPGLPTRQSSSPDPPPPLVRERQF